MYATLDVDYSQTKALTAGSVRGGLAHSRVGQRQ
jgi:hypothetical protein